MLFGTTGDIVYSFRYATGAIGFNGLGVSSLLEEVYHLVGQLEGGFTPSPYNPFAWPAFNLVQHFLKCHFYSPFKVGIAEAACQVALGQTDEDGCLSGTSSLPLERVEDLIHIQVHR